MNTPLSLVKLTKDHIEEAHEILKKWYTSANGNFDEKNYLFFSQLLLESIEVKSKEKFFVSLTQTNEVVAIIGYSLEVSRQLNDYVRLDRPLQITFLMVQFEKIGQGIGTDTLRAFETWAKKNECTEVVLTSSQQWEKSWEFYRNAGYDDRGELKNNGNFHTKVFCKQLYEGCVRDQSASFDKYKM